jgi:predicted GNAT family acetyltransferase
MNITQIEQGSKGTFVIKENNELMAEMTYSKAGDKLIIIDHTEVSDVLRGKGAGKQLIEAAVEFARKQGLKILPLCPFAQAIFEKTPAFKDVLNT